MTQTLAMPVSNAVSKSHTCKPWYVEQTRLLQEDLENLDALDLWMEETMRLNGSIGGG